MNSNQKKKKKERNILLRLAIQSSKKAELKQNAVGNITAYKLYTHWKTNYVSFQLLHIFSGHQIF